jgi:CheY-like chemotaxis protein
LENALLNLSLNARDAMPVGGKLTIETTNCFLDETYIAGITEPVERGQYVLIAVTDTGTGMDKATVERVFDPFFTTKEAGKGTGLGLSQVYGFVRQSSGHIRVYSEVGEGTTVKIYLPRYTGSDAPAERKKETNAPPRAVGAETVLVVEDDPALRGYTAEVLTELGYQVLEAADGAAALAILRAGAATDILFTDVVMPGGMNGRQLAEAGRALRPELKVLFTTGYTRNAIIHHGRLDPGVELISKPYSAEGLAKKLRQVIDGTP